MINWLKYLEVYYGPEKMERFPHRLVKANVGHDYVGMINSQQGEHTICYVFTPSNHSYLFCVCVCVRVCACVESMGM